MARSGTKVDLVTMKPIKNWAEWKAQFPDRSHADSKLEASFYRILKERNINFVFQPEKSVLIPSFRSSTYDVKKKEMKEKTILQQTWRPDFYLIDHDIYLECKGHANEAFGPKLKLARWNWVDRGVDVVVLNTQRDLNAFLDHITDKSYVSGRELKEKGTAWEEEVYRRFNKVSSLGIRKTSHKEDSEGIDLVLQSGKLGTTPIQCKSAKRDVHYSELLTRIPEGIVLHQKTEKTSRGYDVLEEYAVMPLHLLEKLLI